MFGIYRIAVYSRFGLDRFHCILKSVACSRSVVFS